MHMHLWNKCIHFQKRAGSFLSIHVLAALDLGASVDQPTSEQLHSTTRLRAFISNISTHPRRMKNVGPA